MSMEKGHRYVLRTGHNGETVGEYPTFDDTLAAAKRFSEADYAEHESMAQGVCITIFAGGQIFVAVRVEVA